MMSTKILLYTHKTYSNGKHPVMMQVIFNRHKKKISLGYHARPKEWNPEKSRFRRSVDNYDEKNTALRRYELLDQKIIDESILPEKPVSLLEFKWKFSGNQTTNTDFFDFCVYNNVRNSLKLFVDGPLCFEDINVTFLNKYESWLASNKYSRNGYVGSTMNQYMRTICSIINKAISRDIIPQYYIRSVINLIPRGILTCI